MPQTLDDYVQEVQTFLRDSKQDLLDPGDIVKHVNRARREIALRTQSVRRLTPISGQVITASVVAGGMNYSNSPTITISSPDFPSGQGPFPNGDRATASAIVQSGTIAAVDIDYGGAGYWQPVATIADAHGTGASISLQISTIQQLDQGRELYKFSDIDLSPFPGVKSVYAVQSVSLLYSGFRYSLVCYSFSTYQALIRIWAQQYQYVPAVFAQYGQGTDGSIFCYPLPSQAYQCELDCYCLPSDLETDLSVEAIPDPWTDAVAFLAGSFCYMDLQNFNAAKYYESIFKEKLLTYSNAARVNRVTNPYGRYAGGY